VDSQSFKAWLSYGILSLVYGSTYFAIAVGIESFNTFGMVATRYLLAGIVAFLLGRLMGEPWPSKRDLPHLIFVGVLLLTTSNGLVTYAERHVSSGISAVVCSLVPGFYVLLGRERLSPRSWAGLALGLCGVAILMLARPDQHRLHPGGMACLLLAVFCWAVGTLHGRKHVQGKGLMGQVGVQMMTGGLVSLAFVPFTGGFLHAPLTWKAASAVGFLSLFGSLIAFSAFIYLAKVWKPSRMGTYVYINPVVAVLLGCAVLKEPFNLAMGLGMIVILAGIALLQIPVRKPH